MLYKNYTQIGQIKNLRLCPTIRRIILDNTRGVLRLLEKDTSAAVSGGIRCSGPS